MHFLPLSVCLFLFLSYDFLQHKANFYAFSARRFVDFGVELNLCFIVSAVVIGLPLHSMNMLRIRHLITKYKIDSQFFKSRFL